MSEKTGVDVLQTIDKALARVRLIGWPHVMDLEDARSAVAELMEAAQEAEKWAAGQRVADPWERLNAALAACRSPAKDK